MRRDRDGNVRQTHTWPRPRRVHTPHRNHGPEQRGQRHFRPARAVRLAGAPRRLLQRLAALPRGVELLQQSLLFGEPRPAPRVEATSFLGQRRRVVHTHQHVDRGGHAARNERLFGAGNGAIVGHGQIDQLAHGRS